MPVACNTTAATPVACWVTPIAPAPAAGDQRGRLPDASQLVLETLLALARSGFDVDDLDALQRPRSFADQLVHHGCPRNEY